ncbi:hypothetical protein GCM10009624_00510 [Gordonia sinesedis]
MEVLDSALLRGRTTLPQLRAAQDRNRGRRGSTIAESMLAAAAGGARSEAERRLHRLLRQGGVIGWEANAEHCGYLLDVAFADLKLAIEVDGFAWHSGATEFRHDRQRQNVLVGNGWTVLRFTWADLTEHPQRVLAEIRAAIRKAAAA